jgi:signal transduction histidine kinase
MCSAAETFADGRVRIREEEGVLADGQPHHYIVRTIPLVRNNGQGSEIPFTIEMSTDVTEIKMLEKEKLEAERLAAVGETVAGLAHGIKNVLMGLEGGVYIVRTGMKNADSNRILRGWGVVEENIDRISAFVKEFLDFAKGRTAKVAATDPNLIATKVIELFRDSARLVDIELTCDLASGIESAYLDEEGIHACLVNLVSNALDACEMSDKRGGHVHVSTADRDGTLLFEVADDGTGMDSEIGKKVFTKFFSTKGSERGTGLGLLTTKKIVQQHGGKVSFESSEGSGSVFRLEFPRDRLPEPNASDS